MAQDSIIAIAQEIRQCTLCKHELPLGPRPIFQLDSRTKIVIASQAPGRLAHESGRPFDDPSGARLKNWLGVDNETFYNAKNFAIVPMGFCYPGKAKTGDLPPRTECAEAWRKRTLAALDNVQLTLAIGQHAIKYHVSGRQKTLTETVKQWQNAPEDILPMPHPSPLNNIWLKRNPWYENEFLPMLKNKIQHILSDG